MTEESRIHNGESTVCSINSVGKTEHKRMKLDCYLTPYTKINLKLIKDLNVRPETITLYKKKIGGKFLVLSLGDEISIWCQKPKAIKEKKKKKEGNHFKLKSFHIEKKNRQNEKATYQMEENICKWYIW